jgi:hypothetical protein
VPIMAGRPAGGKGQRLGRSGTLGRGAPKRRASQHLSRPRSARSRSLSTHAPTQEGLPSTSLPGPTEASMAIFSRCRHSANICRVTWRRLLSNTYRRSNHRPMSSPRCGKSSCQNSRKCPSSSPQCRSRLSVPPLETHRLGRVDHVPVVNNSVRELAYYLVKLARSSARTPPSTT